MITIEPVLVVEGTYDKIKLESLVDTLIIPTNGFAVFHDKEKLDLLKAFANTRGVLILTDSDHAGFQIRNRLKQHLEGGKVFHAYIPDIYGKEKRKQKPTTEGKLGVEGMPPKVLLQAIRQAGVDANSQPREKTITKCDFYRWGLSGMPNAKQQRLKLQKQLGLPENCSANTLLEICNRLYAKDEIEKVLSPL